MQKRRNRWVRQKDDGKTEPCNHEAVLGQKGDS